MLTALFLGAIAAQKIIPFRFLLKQKWDSVAAETLIHEWRRSVVKYQNLLILLLRCAKKMPLHFSHKLI